MLPKIDKKILQKPEPFYPKQMNRYSDKENNITKLKKLREFLENKSINVEEKYTEWYSHNANVISSIAYGNKTPDLPHDLALQESDRSKANTSEVSRKKKKIQQPLDVIVRWSMERKEQQNL